MSAPHAERSTRSVATACRICAVGCGTIVELDGDRVVSVAGDPDDPISAGYTCSKGRAGPTFHHHRDRIDFPLVKTDGTLVAASWDTALTDVAERLAAVIAESGPHAVAGYLGTGGPLDPAGFAMAHGLLRSIGTDQQYSALSIDCPSKFLVPQLVAGVQLMFQPDIDHTDLVLAIGANTVVSHGHGLMTPNPLGRIRSLRDRGGALVVVDPRRTETARHADLHLQIRPGTDPALLAFAVRSMFEQGPDQAFLDDCADATSVERLRAAVAPYDRARTAAVTGLDPLDLERLERLVTRSGRVGIETGTGVSMSRSAMMTEWLAWALAGVTGSLDRRGGNTFNPGFLRPMEEAPPAGRGDLGPRPASRPDLPRIVNGEMPCAALADEIEAGNVRALIVRVGNPAMAFPDDRKLRRALASLDVLVVVDARHTATTELATHVLPIADHFERGDLLTGYLQAAPFMRWSGAVVDPIGERRPQWWIFAEIAKRLGYPLLGSERRDRVLAGRDLDDEVIAETICHGARHTWHDVRAAPYGIVDESVAPGWLIPGRLPAPLDLAPTDVVDAFTGSWTDRLPDHDELVLVNRRTSGQYNSLSAEVTADTSHHAPPTLLISPADATLRGLADHDRITVTSDHGSCSAVIEVSEGVLDGVVSLPHAWPGSDVNRLTSDRDVDPLSAMPVLSGFRVNVAADAPTPNRDALATR